LVCFKVLLSHLRGRGTENYHVNICPGRLLPDLASNTGTPRYGTVQVWIAIRVET